MSRYDRRQPRRDRADRHIDKLVVEGCSVKERRRGKHRTTENADLDQVGHMGAYHG